MSEKQILIVTIAALVLVLIAGGGAVWYFQFNVLAGKKQQLTEIRKQLDDAKAKAAKIGDLKKEIVKIEAETKEKQQRIPTLDRTEYDTFANLLDENRRQAGVFVPAAKWVNVKAATGRAGPAAPASMHKVQYDMTVRGTFYQLLRYVNLFEEDKRFINVESFSISGGATSGAEAGKHIRNMRLILFSYTYRPPAAEPLPPPVQRAGLTTAIPE